MTKHAIGNAVATTAAVLTGVAVMYISIRFLHKPESAIDWTVMLFSGLVSGIFIFFIVWGHFQPATSASPPPANSDPK